MLFRSPSPFISISGMLYRMKQNAVGLANITILATMVIVAVSTTIAVFIGIQGTLDIRFPYENKVTYYTDANIEEELKTIQTETETLGLEVTGTEIYTYYNLYPVVEDNELILGETDYSANEIFQAKIIVQEDYEKMTNQTIDLESDEILVYDLKKIGRAHV